MSDEPRVRRILRLREVRRDLDEELAFHFEQVIHELRSRGLGRAEAEAEAERRFGDAHRYRHELFEIDRTIERGMRWRDRVGALRDTVKYAWRSMSYAPALSFGIVLAFALGIGANATVFNLIDRLLLRAPPQLADPASLRVYTLRYTNEVQGGEVYDATRAYPDLGDLRDAASLAGSAAYNFSPRDLTIGWGEGAQRVRGLMVSGDYFSLLGVTPLLGRVIGAADDQVGVERVVMLSHGYWQRQYAGARDAIGRAIDFGQGPHTIVGVLPKGFTGIDLTPVDLWVPLVPYRNAIEDPDWQQSRGDRYLKIVVRLAPGVSNATAEAELTARFTRIYADNIRRGAFRDARVILASVIPGRSPMAPAEVNVARWLALMSLAVLVIASLNISNLLLARAIRDQRALGIRLALGITRARIIGQVLVEVVLFALAGGAAALLIAKYGGVVVQRIFLPNYAWDAIGISSHIAWVTAAIALLAAVAAALLPALQMARSDVLTALRANASAIAGRPARLRTTLVVVQVTLSVILLAGAGVFVRSFRSAAHADLGINPDRAWNLRLVTDDEIDADRLHSELAAVLNRVPGISAAGASSTQPFYERSGGPLRVEGWDSVLGRVYRHLVQGRYFEALGLDLLSGRLIGPDDLAGAEPAAVVNQELARQLFPAGPIGRCLYVGRNATRCTRIVGVVETAHMSGIRAAPAMQFYITPAQHPDVSDLEVLVLRMAEDADAATVLAEARRALTRADARVRYVEAASLHDLLEFEMRSWRLGAVLFSAFGLLALLLATLGLYAVVSFDVSQQMRELGLRAALGASSRRLLFAVLQRAAVVAVLGLVIGVAIALAAAPRLAELVYAVSPRDPFTLAVVAFVLLGTAGIAALLPAARAARVDPLLLIRSE